MAEIVAGIYEIIGKLGAGGGGTAYLANHLRLNKRVVLKADRRKITTSPELLRREVDVLKNLSHPFIPQVYDFFNEGGTVYTVMDFIDGESLDQPLKRGEHFAQSQVIGWGIQVLEALSYLHAPVHGDPPRGFVHSDIKPANIMWRPTGDICLIDYNIALAIGEENVVGGSAGYASPEHYGLDYSSSGLSEAGEETALMGDETATIPMSRDKLSVSAKKVVVPDVRSDIYSTGATLYHLLSGHRPAKLAVDVVPLSEQEFSPQLVKIITKAMSPNPDLRYQTAEEMLSALKHLHENDPRTVRFKRSRNIVAGVVATAVLAGVGMTFAGLGQMERAQAVAAQEAQRAQEEAQRAQGALTAIRSSEAARQKGDLPGAKRYALAALSEESPYQAQARKALTDALDVYDLSDGLKAYCTVELPTEALKLAVSPEGSRTAAMYAYQVVVADTGTGETLAQLPTRPTAVSDFAFLNENVLLYAGENGLTAFDVSAENTLWTGEAVTRLTLSEDGSSVAGLSESRDTALVYSADSGQLKGRVSLQRVQNLPAGDGILADPEDELFALNANGTLLAASLENGGLTLFDVATGEPHEILDTSDYTHFEGGFYDHYFAFSAWNASESILIIYDTDTMTQTGGFSGTTPFRTRSDDRGVCVAADNLLVEVDPVTGEQQELAYTSADIVKFVRGRNGYTLVAIKDGSYAVFNESAQLVTQGTREKGCEYLDTAGEYVVLASLETPTVQILKMETHPEAQLCGYDPTYPHVEARFNAQKTVAMLFQYDTAYLVDPQGQLLAQVDFPDADQVYDQQYRRDADGSRLEVTWNDGTVRAYSGEDGALLWERQGDIPDESLHETFETTRWRIEAPLHGAATVYDKTTGEAFKELEQDSYLTYVTEVGDYIVTQYISGQGERYGLLLNQDCETLAYLPGLCDVLDETLIFDDTMGNLRQSRIYSLDELKDMAQ